MQAAGVVLLTCLVGAIGCKKTPSDPGDPDPDLSAPILLSSGSPTQDEDPSVLRARDGTMFVAWFSDRNNNPDIYVASTRDRKTWTVPIRVTTGTAGDFYPNLFQDDQGLFHLTWFQWVSLFVGQIRHSTSADGVTWSPEEAVTTTVLVDDWLHRSLRPPMGPSWCIS